MGNGNIVPLDQAKIVILSFPSCQLTPSELGEIAYDDEDEQALRLVEDDMGRALVSWKWVLECCKASKVFRTGGYVVRLPPRSR